MKKVLFVENDGAYMKLLQDGLTEQGYRVIEATDGQKDLELSKFKHPVLIILDIEMP